MYKIRMSHYSNGTRYYSVYDARGRLVLLTKRVANLDKYKTDKN